MHTLNLLSGLHFLNLFHGKETHLIDLWTDLHIFWFASVLAVAVMAVKMVCQAGHHLEIRH